MPATFKQKSISVREELNALQGLKDRSVDPGYCTDIGGGETLWGDGSITGENSNGSYTKWPNGDLECVLNDKTYIDMGGAVNTYDHLWTYPYEFINAFVAVFGGAQGGRIGAQNADLIAIHRAGNISMAASSNSFRIARNEGLTFDEVRGIFGYATGKWKN